MKFLLLILSVMTWTVQDKRTVSGDGEWPYDIDVNYSCTYQKGDVRDGDTATLSLANLGGITVNKIEVYVQSNASSGAGTFTVVGNDKTLATKSGTFKDWVGQYDNSKYHPIAILTTERKGLNTLSVTLAGTANSLHIEKYVITYQPAPAYEVTLMVGNDEYSTLAETSGGTGVVLPSLADKEDWRFVGWTDGGYWRIDQLPETWWPAGATYHPQTNTTLWALWKYAEAEENSYITDLVSGDYIYLNKEGLFAVSGAPSGGQLICSKADVTDEQQIYHVTFNAAGDSATIQHKATGRYIGYSGTSKPVIAEKQSSWQVWHSGDTTAFYTVISNKTYILWPNIYGNDEYYAGLFMTYDVSQTTTALMSAQHKTTETIYTCHPESELGTDIVGHTGEAVDGEFVIRLGNYELIIRNGKKYIRL